MQYMLFPDFFFIELQKYQGIVGQNLLILKEILHGVDNAILEMIERDQQKGLNAIHGTRYKGKGRRYGGPSALSSQVLLYFVICRGYYPNCYGKRGFDLLLENSGLHMALADLGVSKFPGRSTIHEHLNFLSDETVDVIHRAILQAVLKEGVDDFNYLTMDSTAIASVSTWPLDSNMLYQLFEKCFAHLKFGIYLRSLEKGWASKINTLPMVSTEKLLQSLKGLTQDIAYAKGKKGADQIRRHGYLLMCKQGQNLLAKIDDISDRIKLLDFEDKVSKAYEESWELANEKLYFVEKRFGMAQAGDMGEMEPELLLSLSDQDAAFISKGGREKIFGYRPNLSMSTEGFITSILIDSGNTSDSTIFIQSIKDHQKQTGVLPMVVSTDDGYTSAANWDKAIELGVELTSFSGSKGKALFGEELWQDEQLKELRRNRSNAEARISHFKIDFHMQRLSVGGIERVRREIKLRAISYNIELLGKKILKRHNAAQQIKKMAA